MHVLGFRCNSEVIICDAGITGTSQQHQTVVNVATVHQLVRFGTFSALYVNIYASAFNQSGQVRSYALYRNRGTRKHQDSANLQQYCLSMVMSADIPYPDFSYWRDRKIRNIVQLRKKNNYEHIFTHDESQHVHQLPVQVDPSPVYPGRQVHVKLPGLLVQVARALQFPLFSAHSSISTAPQDD